MSLQVIAGGRAGDPDGPRALAPGAPRSPGKPPSELAEYLARGEVLTWWNRKQGMQWGLIGITLGAAAFALGGVTAFAPTFWLQPLAGIAWPLGALLSPTAFVLLREWLARGYVLVTDDALLRIGPSGSAWRVPLTSIVAIRRDWLGGGVQVVGRGSAIRIPPSLVDDTRTALVTRLQRRIMASTEIDDPLGWLS